MIEAKLHQQSRKEWMVPRSVVKVKSGRVYVLVTNVATKAVRIRPSECKFRARIISDDEADCRLEEKGVGRLLELSRLAWRKIRWRTLNLGRI